VAARARKQAGSTASKSGGARAAKKRATKKRGARSTGGSAKKNSKKRTKKKAKKARGAKRKAAKKARRAAGSKPTRPRRARAFRLDPDVRPTAFDIHLDVDPTTSDAYRGEVGINLQLARSRRAIELHACDMRVRSARAHVGGKSLRGKIVPHPTRETVEIKFPATLPAGHARLEISWSARLRGDLCGLYRATSGDNSFAFSQLAPTNARRMFPCFDEPAMKARYRISVTTGEHNRVLSNSPIEAEDALSDGRKTVHFSPTPPLSSYLIAVAVGPLESSRPKSSGATEIRVWYAPGKRGLADFALDTACETLARLETYFGLVHPYPKLDLVAVPDFEFGAMENPGAVFFRETLLLLDPDQATLAEKKRVAEVICHELAHMWYGDLVTMAWWDDLWLNEAFATWMAFRIVDEWRPEWKMWQVFQLGRAAAMEDDALLNTHSIYAPVDSAQEAAQNFDLITYEKGAAVIRMLERYLGPDVFREGVRRYIRRHRESNAVAADLWNALSEVADARVEEIVRPWLEQEGHPVISVARGEKDGLAVVELKQERFLLSRARRGGAAGKRSARWPVPLVGRIGTGKVGETRTVRHLLTRVRESIPARGADLTFIYGNADEGGFYRPHHDADLMRDLVDELPNLEPVERQGLVDHQWALVRSGHAPIASLLDLLAAVGAETDPAVLATARLPLLALSKRLAPDVSPECEQRLRAWVEVYYGGQVDELGWRMRPKEPDDHRLRRAEVLGIVGMIGEASRVVRQASQRFERYLEDRSSIDPNLTDLVVSLAASHGDSEVWQVIHRAMLESVTPQDERRFLLALGDFTGEETIATSLELCLGDEIAVQDVAGLLVRLLLNRHACEPTWAFVKKHWSKLQKHIPPHLAVQLVAATPALRTTAYRKDVASFFARNPIPTAERALRQALDRFDWYPEYRDRVGPQLASYLSLQR